MVLMFLNYFLKEVIQLICQNHKEDFVRFCVFLRKSELYQLLFTITTKTGLSCGDLNPRFLNWYLMNMSYFGGIDGKKNPSEKVKPVKYLVQRAVLTCHMISVKLR